MAIILLKEIRVEYETSIKKAFAVILYSLGKASYGFIAKLFGVTRAAAFRWLKKEATLIEKPQISSKIRNIEFDEMWHCIKLKNKKWITKTVDLDRRSTIGWVIGNRDVKTFRKLYDKVKHLKLCASYQMIGLLSKEFCHQIVIL